MWIYSILALLLTGMFTAVSYEAYCLKVPSVVLVFGLAAVVAGVFAMATLMDWVRCRKWAKGLTIPEGSD